MSEKKLFISHAHADRVLVNAFVDLLDTGCQIPRGEIFCTSLPDINIEPGQPFIRVIQDNIRTAKRIILMLSPNFYNSEFCLGELGATWALDIPVFPIVIPDMEIGRIGNLLTGVQMDMITDKFHLDRLRDLLKSDHGITDFNTATWTLKRDEFLDELPALLGEIPKPKAVSLQEYEDLKATYETYHQQCRELKKEVERKDQIIAELKKAKDSEQVAGIILQSLPERERFEEMCEEVGSKLHQLHDYVKRAIYHEHKNSGLKLEMYEYQPDADRLIDEGYLIWNEDEKVYCPNSRDRTIAEAQKAIRKLAKFLRSGDVSEEFLEAFHRENGYDLDLDNMRFWKDYLW